MGLIEASRINLFGAVLIIMNTIKYYLGGKVRMVTIMDVFKEVTVKNTRLVLM